MAAVTHRSSTASTSNTTSYASGSFTPGNGELLVCAVVATATAAAAPTLTDSLSGSWTLVATAPWNGTTNSIYLFVRTTLIGTGAAMTVTFDCTGDAATGVVIEVAGVSGMTNTGATAVLQSAVNKNGAATTPATTFTSAAQTGNPTLVFLGSAANPPGVTVPTGWTQQDSTGYGSPTTGSQYVSRDSGFTGTTITWGSTSSGLWGALAVELDASGSGTTVTPGVGALTLTGFAPTVLTPQKVLPGVGQLTLTGFAPTVLTPRLVQPGVGQLTLTGFAPTVLTPRLVQTGLGQLTLTGFAPTVVIAPVGSSVLAQPGVGQLTLTGFAPTVLTPQKVLPGVGALTLTGFAPTVLTPQKVQPGVGALTLTGFAPTVLTPRTVQTGLGALTLTGFAPTVVVAPASSVGLAQPGVGQLTLTGFAPTVVIAPAQNASGFRRILYTEDEPTRRRRKKRPEPEQIVETVSLPEQPPLLPGVRITPSPRITLPKVKTVVVVELDDEVDDEEALMVLMHILAELD